MTQTHRSPSVHLLATLSVTMLSVASPAFAADYHVSTSGTDGAAGSASAPWRTLQYAANNVGAGDVVHVAPGTYVGFNMTTDGTAGARIVFVADGPGAVINQRNASTTDCVNLEGASYVTVEGFTVEDAPRCGLRAVQATGVVFRNNTISRSGLTGILTGYTPSILIEGNVISASSGEHGIYVSNSSTPADNPVIRGNDVYGNNKNGIQLNGDCQSSGDGIIEGALVEGNLVHNNNWKGLSIISTQASVFQNNVVYDNGISAGAGGLHLADEPGCGHPSSNNLVVNNTFMEPRIACIRMTDGSTGNVVFNNICIAASSSNTVVDEVGGNLIDTASNLRLTTTTGLFADAAAKNFHLAASSGAIDAGIPTYQGRPAPAVDRDGLGRPTGGNYDAGAYEAGGSAPVVDVTPPTVRIDAPQNNATIASPTALAATASDNVVVARVEFLIDGQPIAVPGVAAPYTASLDPRVYQSGFYTLTARATDDSGNSATSAPVSIVVRNDTPSAGIPTGHPRLSVINGRLQELRRDACYDDAGNRIPGCTPTEFANVFFNFVDTSTKTEAWHHALAYQVTQNRAYADRAIQDANELVSCDFQCVVNSHNQFLYVRDYIRTVCLVYDWCYDVLTATERASYVNYMNKLMFLTWNDTAEANAIYDTSDWSTSNPKNNFFYNYLLASTYVALATYGENPGSFVHNGTTHQSYYYMDARDQTSDRYTDIYEFTLAKLREQAFNSLDTIGEGGGWIEGENYGRASKRHLFEALLLLKQTAGIDYFNDTAHPFAREAVRYQLYTVQPGNGVLYPGGDASQDPILHVNPYDRHLMLLAADGLAGTPEGGYAQYFCNNVIKQMSGISVMIPVDFFNYRPTLSERNYNELPTAYFASGIGWITSRSSWSTDAISVTFVSADCIQGHQHRDQNAFVIYAGGNPNTGDGWLVTDTQPYSSTLPRSSFDHNTFVIANTSQRFGAGTGAIIREERDKPGYMYAVGDASDAYWTNPGSYSHGDEKLTDVFQRELVHLFPGYVVVFDRVSLASKFATAEVKSMLHFPYVKPTQSGDTWVSTTGPNRVFQRILLPAAPSISWVDEDAQSSSNRIETWRMELKDSVTRPNYQFLNVFYATRASVSTMPATAQVASQEGNMVGAVIKDPSQEHVIMFSSDPSGAPPVGNINYRVGLNLDSRQMLFDLVPGMGYAVSVTGTDDGYRVAVSEGGPHVASNAGSLVFTLDEILTPSIPLAAAR
ncbi:MAG TPA: right-handed parallel beta-helix repeat-containing protein [Candidatus Krumholzibacteria bacterium]|nr:right-handed parallel beta-helix repeat-containing protein [Candidatus Krumholzibacteria bacterium]